MSSDAIKPWRHILGGQRGYLCIFSGYRTEDDELEDHKSRYFEFPGQIEAAAEYTTEESAAGRETYFCAHLLRARRRIKENAAAVSALWCELDGADVPNGNLKPTAVVESSPGHYHAYWRLTNPVSPDAAEQLNRRLAKEIGADASGFDLTQLLRVPGTVNHKYSERPVVKVLDLELGQAYAPAELDKLLPPPSGNGHRASSESTREPPVALDAEGMKAWRGEKPKPKADGTVDRSASLLKIGRALYDTGANRTVIVEALRERDAALGWRCYTDRRDAEIRYQEIVDELEENGRNPRITFGERAEEVHDQKEKCQNQADRLIGYALKDVQALFTDQHGAPHALVDGTPVPLTSRCYSWLRRLMWEQEEKAVNGEYLKTAAGTLAAHAEFSGETRELHTRAAFYEGALYYELRPGRVVRVDAVGWSFEQDPPVLFRRYPNLKPLPDPEPGSSAKALADYTNLRTNRDKRLFTAYAATVPLPHVGRPILNGSGAMGSGKTTLGRVVKRLWDPTAPETVRLDPRDFLQKALHAYIVMLDNQNSVPGWAADTLCRLVTGEADSKRRLYTDDEDVIIELRRAVLLNGINVPTDRGDVMDRSLVVELERIPDGQRKTEEELWESFEREHPKLLEAFFDVLSQAIARRSSIKLPRRPRLADWGEHAASVYEVMGWGAEAFLSDWDAVVRVQNQATLDGSPVAQAVIKFMEDKENYEGAPADVHKKLEGVAESLGVSIVRDKAWPKSSRWLWRRIKEVLPLLVTAGIEAGRRHSESGTVITLRKTPGNDVSDVRGEKFRTDKLETPDIKDKPNVSRGASNVSPDNRPDSNAGLNVSPNPHEQAESGQPDNTDFRYGDSSEDEDEGGELF